MTINALVLAAGEGRRLRPLTNDWPKCLMPIRGVPILEYWLSDLIANGVETVFVNTSYKYKIVEKFLKRQRFEGHVRILYEKELLGTGGTLSKWGGEFLDKPTLVIHADNWCGGVVKFLLKQHRFSRPYHCEITMLTFKTADPKNCGIVELDVNSVVTGFYEKIEKPPSNVANGAVYVFEPTVMECIENTNISDLSTEVIPKYLGKIFAVPTPTFHRDIGTLDNLIKSQFDPKLQTLWAEQDQWALNFSKHPIHNELAVCLANG